MRGLVYEGKKRGDQKRKNRGETARPPLPDLDSFPKLLALFTIVLFTLLNNPRLSHVSCLSIVIVLIVFPLTHCAHRPFAMADSSESRPVARVTKPVSEALLNEKVRIHLERLRLDDD